MLLRSIPDRTLGALLGSDSTANVFYRHLRELSQNRSLQIPMLKMKKLRQDLQAAIHSDIDNRTGRVHRLNEIEPAVESLCNEPFLSTTDIPQLNAAFDAVLHYNDDGKIQIQDIHVQRYAEMLAELDPTLLVAWHLVEKSETKGNGKQASLRKAVNEFPTLFVGSRFDKHPFAENHAHLAGVTGNELVVAQVILAHKEQDVGFMTKDEMQRVRRVRRILESLTNIWTQADLDVNKKLMDKWTIDVLEIIPDEDKNVMPNPLLDWDTFAKGIVVKDGGSGLVSSQWLMHMLAESASNDQIQIAWIWLFILLWRTYRFKQMKETARAVILLIIIDIMVLRRQLLMDGCGLRRFTTKYYSSSLRDEAKKLKGWDAISSQDAARRLFAYQGDKAAIKVGIDTLGKAWLSSLARDANARIRVHENAPHLSHQQSRAHWHLCVHFNRVTKEQQRRELWKKAESLRNVLYTDVAWTLAGQVNEEESVIGSEYKVFPSEMIRGLDVVGDETRWPIERFAPILRWLRSPSAELGVPMKLPKGLGPEPPVPRLHLSIHAGEDYAHPLSGLRHIDETVEFCGMGTGDRLGHALALGIPPDEWLKRNGDVELPLDEHVDNLVWAWYRSKNLEHLEWVKRVRSRLEARISRLLPHMSWYPQENSELQLAEIDPLRLYQAWVLRKNCPYKALEQPGVNEIVGPDLEIGAPDWSLIRAKKGIATTCTAEGLYVLRAEHEARALATAEKPRWQVRLTVQRHGYLTRRQREQEELNAAALSAESKKPIPYLHDHDDADDLRCMLALQDERMETYALLGITIETNPSSNVYIGQLQTHSDHPIYRWNPPNQMDLNEGARFNKFALRHRPMPVTINTDDPGMIPTTLRMEHHLMHEGALDRGYTEKEADDWIERLRQSGIALFDQAH